MRWLTPHEHDLAPGSGPWVILADRSASIPVHTHAVIAYAVKGLMAKHSGIRAFGYAGGVEGGVEEVDGERNRDTANCHPDSGKGTDLGYALKYVSALNPRRVTIFSDGEDVNKSKTLRIAEQMKCPIDCFFCEPSFELFAYEDDWEICPQGIHFGSRDKHYHYHTKDVDPAFLQELARRARGRCWRWAPDPAHPLWDWYDSKRLEQLLLKSVQPKPRPILHQGPIRRIHHHNDEQRGPSMSRPPRRNPFPEYGEPVFWDAQGNPHYEVIEEVHVHHVKRTHVHEREQVVRHSYEAEQVQHQHAPQIEHRGQPQQGRPAISNGQGAAPQGGFGRFIGRMFSPPEMPQIEPPRQAPSRQAHQVQGQPGQPYGRQEVDRGALRSTDVPQSQDGRRIVYLAAPKRGNGGR